MYVPNTERYAAMTYRRCGKSGLKLPEVSLGLWHNFGDTNTLEHMEAICKAAFDGGITHFDLQTTMAHRQGLRSRISERF